MSCSSLGDEAANFNMVWEVEAKGRTKILEAKERRMRRIQEARYLATIENERYKEEKEAEFNKKCQSFKHEDEERMRILVRDVELELDYMEARVQLCKSTVVELLEMLVINARYAIHQNVTIRRWITGLDKRHKVPLDRQQCDQMTWELIYRYAFKCEELASKIPYRTGIPSYQTSS